MGGAWSNGASAIVAQYAYTAGTVWRRPALCHMILPILRAQVQLSRLRESWCRCEEAALFELSFEDLLLLSRCCSLFLLKSEFQQFKTLPEILLLFSQHNLLKGEQQ